MSPTGPPEENYTRLSPNYTTKDWWNTFVKKAPDWETAIKVVEDGFNARFIRPADLLMDSDFGGFAIVVLDCLLLEALHAFRTGKRRHDKRSVYRKILTGPPVSLSDSPTLEFYDSIRSGIFEDGEARYGWNIILRSKTAFPDQDRGAWAMNRTMFHERLKRAVATWVQELRTGDTVLRNNMRTCMAEILRKHYLL